MTRNILFSPPDISENDIDEVTKILRSGWITTGSKTKEFENEIAEFCHAEKAVCLNSATSAMEITLRILGVGSGDEVITSAYTYTASASVIDHVGAKIVLCDVVPGTYQMDYDKMRELITERTKVIIPVDIGGIPCDYNAVFSAIEDKKHLFKPNSEIQKQFGRIIVLGDSAHSLGAIWHEKPIGSIADFTSFSFHAVKNLTTAEGGAVCWSHKNFIDNEQLYKSYMLMSLHGQSKDALSKTTAGSWEYDIVAPYYKNNMTDIMAALGSSQLKRYTRTLARRKQLVELYNKFLSDDKFIYATHYTDDFLSSGHLYLLRIDGISEEQRNLIIIKMAEKGVACNVHYKPLPMHTAYRNLGFDIHNYEGAHTTYHNEITLPLHTKLFDDDVEYVATTLKEIVEQIKPMR